MPARGQPRDVRLKIVACRQIYSGVSKGRGYTIFEVDAAKPDGTLVQEKLRAFEALPIGQEVEVSVQAFDSEEHGRSYTLHRKVSNNATQRVNELEPRVKELERQVEELTRIVNELRGNASQPAIPPVAGW